MYKNRGKTGGCADFFPNFRVLWCPLVLGTEANSWASVWESGWIYLLGFVKHGVQYFVLMCHLNFFIVFRLGSISTPALLALRRTGQCRNLCSRLFSIVECTITGIPLFLQILATSRPSGLNQKRLGRKTSVMTWSNFSLASRAFAALRFFAVKTLKPRRLKCPLIGFKKTFLSSTTRIFLTITPRHRARCWRAEV